MILQRKGARDHPANHKPGEHRGESDCPRGTGPTSRTDERHPLNGPTGRGDQYQVRKVPGPASEAPREGRGQWSFPSGVGIRSPWEGPPKLQFIRLSPTAKAPTRATTGAIGYDLYTPFSFTLYPQDTKLVYTDIAIGVPVGHYGRVAPKSGLTLNHHVTVLAGVIDPDYTGNVGVVLHNLSSDTKFTRLVGEPIAQLVLEVASILPTQEVRTLPISARGPHGFGSHD